MWAGLLSAWPALLLPQQGFAASILSGNVSGTLDAANSPYRVTGNITVPSAQTLTLEAGVIVKFQPGTGLTVNGTLVSNGTSGDPVYLTALADDSVGGDTAGDGATSGAAGQWTTVQFNNSTSATQLTQTVIRYGQSVNLSAASPVFQDVTIGTMSSVAVNADLASFPSGAGNSAVGSPYNVVTLSGGSLGSGSWALVGIPYRINGDVTVSGGATLTVAPGVVIKAYGNAGNGRLVVNGTLLVRGTSGQPVVFTSLRDDSAGGDSNPADGAVSPAAADHRGVFLNAGSSASRFENFILRYGGFQGNPALTLINSTATIINSQFISNSPSALDLQGAGASPTIENSYFLGNSVAIQAGSNDNGPFTVRGSTFIGNGGGAILVGRAAEISGNVFDNNGRAINLAASGTTLFNGNVFRNNITASGSQMVMHVTPTTFLTGGANVAEASNSFNAIFIQAGNVPTGLWQDVGLPFALSGDVTVTAGATLSVAPGTTIKALGNFGNGRLLVNGTVLMPGTPSQPIYFTSLRDDAAGGDSNAGGTGGVSGGPAVGDHRGINLNGSGSSASRLENVVVRYAGFQSNSALIMTHSTASIRSSSFTSNTPAAIDMQGSGAAPTIESSYFQGNSVAIQAGSNDNGPFTVKGSTFVGNGGGAVVVGRAAEISGNLFDNNGRAISLNASGTTLFSGNVFRNNATGSGSQMVMHVTPTTFLTGGGNVAEPTNSFNAIYVQGGNVPTGLWQDVGLPFALAGDVTVTAGATLTVAPGTTIKALGNFGNGRLLVNGTVLMEGTEAQPIYFTSLRDDAAGGDSNVGGTGGVSGAPAVGDHRGINLNGAASSASRFSNVIVRYAGFQSNSALIMTHSTASVRSSTFTSNTPAAIDLQGSGAAPTIESSYFQGNSVAVQAGSNDNGPFVLKSSTFIGNGGGAVVVGRAAEISGNVFDNNGRAISLNASGSTLFNANVFRNNVTASGSQMVMHVTPTTFLTGGGNVAEPTNSFNAIYVQGGNVPTGLWQDVGLPFALAGDVTVTAGATLTISPGTTIKALGNFGNGRLLVNGTVLMEGTPALPIYFTSLRDDAAGGDSNFGGTGGVSGAPAVGDHRGINLNGAASSASRFSNVIVRYAGFQSNSAMIMTHSTASVRSSTFTSNTPAAIDLQGSGAAPTIESSYFQGNSIAIQAGSNDNGPFTVKGSTFVGNGGGAVSVGRAAEISGNLFDNNGRAISLNASGSTLFSGNVLRNNVTASGSQMVMHVTPTTFLTGGGNVAEPTNSFNAVFVQGGNVPTGLWQDVGLPFALAGDVTVPSGATLTVAPGTTIKALGNFGNGRLLVNGTALMVGTPAQPIYFTSLRDDAAGGDSNFGGTGGVSGGPAIGDHRGINLNGAGSSASRLENVVVRYAGFQSNSALIMAQSTASIRSASFTSNTPAAIDLQGSGAAPTIESSFFQGNSIAIQAGSNDNGPFTVKGSTFVGNGGGAVSVGRAAEISANLFDNNGRAINLANAGTTLFSGNVLRNNVTGSGSQMVMHVTAATLLTGGGNVAEPSNSFNAVFVQGGNVPTGAWPDIGLPYSLSGDVTVPSGATLTVAPGVTIKNQGNFGNGRFLVNNGGTLLMVGTSSQPITYTSLRDDSAGGDSNIGGSGLLSGAAAPGDHRGVSLNGAATSASRFENVFFRFSGFQDIPALTLSNSSAAVRNSEFRQNSRQGLLATGGAGAVPLVVNTSFASNSVGLDADSGALPEVHASNFQGNSIGLRNNSAGQLNAENNYWNSTTGPTHSGNPGGAGDAVQGNVDYVPFLGGPSSGVEPTVTGVVLLSVNPLRPGTSAAVRVTFNKNMSATVNPTLTYGRNPPYSDFPITAGSWISGTAYEAATTISVSAAEGLHRLRVSGAQDIAGTSISPADFDFYTVDATPPGAPSLTSAVPQPAGAVALAWQAASGEPSTSYRIYRATEDFTSSAAAVLVSSQPGTSYIDAPAEDGLYYYAVAALDAAGNEGALSNRRSAQSLHAAPSAPANLAAAVFRAERLVSLSWEAPSTGTAAAYDLYRATGATTGLPGMTLLQSGVTSLLTIDRPAVDGFYRYRVAARDLAGNVSDASEEASAYYDVNPPTITISGVAGGQHYRTDRVPVVAVTDFSAFTSTITLNGQPFVSGTTLTLAGAYTLLAQAEDSFAAASSATVSFFIDKASPALSIVSPSSGALLSQDTAVVFVATDDFTSAGQLVVRNQASQAPPYSITAEGLQTLTLTATDLAGNASTASATVTLDKTAPAAVTDLRVTGQREGEVDLAWTAPADAVSGVAAYDLRTATFSITAANFAAAQALPAPAPQTAGTTVSTTVFTDTGVTHYFAVRSTDAAGHASAPSNAAFLDRDGPALSGLSPAFSSLVSRPVTVSVSASDLSGVDRVVFYFDGAAVSTRTSAPYSFALNALAFADGEHALLIRAYDAGGRESVLSGLYNLLYAPPATPTIASPASGFATFSATVAVTGAAEPGTTAQVRLGGVAGATALVASNGTYSVNAVLPVEGDYQLTVVAKDAKGQSNPSAPVTVNYNVAPPNAPRDFSAETRPAGKVRLTWTVPPGKTPSSYRLYRSPSDTALSSGTTPGSGLRVASGVGGTAFEDTPPSDGTFYYGATSVDSSGNESGLSEVSAGLSDRTPPSGALALGASAVGVGQRPLTLTLTEPVASVPILLFVASGAGPLAVSLSPQSPVVWTGTLTVTAATNPGAASFQFQGTDFAGNAGTTLTSGQGVLVDNRGPVGSVTLYPFPPLPAGDVDLALILDEAAASTPTLSFVTAQGSTVAVALEAAGTAGTTWVGTVTVPSGQDGVAHFVYAATDVLGNVGTTLLAGGTFAVDTTAPGAPLSLGAASRPAGVVRLTWSGPIGEPAAAYRVYRDSAALPGTVAPQGDQTGRFDDSPSEGAHVYQVASLDTAGNEGALSNAASGLSDATPPPVPSGAAAAINGFGSVDLSWSAQPGETYRVYRTTYSPPSLTGLAFTLVSASPVTDVPPQNGLIRYFLTALDGAGNVSTAAATATVFYDRAPPVITVTGVANNALYNHGVFPAFSASDPALDTATVQGRLNGSPFTSGSLVAAEEEHTLVVTAANLGGVGSTVTVHFALDLTSPTVSVTGVVSGQSYHAAVLPIVDAADPRLASVAVTLDGAAYTPGVPVSADGVHALVVTARDLAGNVTSSTTTFTLDLPPLAPPSFNVSIEEGLGAALSWQSPGADVVGYRAFRDGTPLHQGLLTGQQLSDSSYALGQARVFEVAAVDIAGQEGARARASIPAVTVELESYGTLESGAPALTRGFFDAIRLRMTNASGSAKLVGPATIELVGGASSSGQAASASVPAGGQAVAEGVVAVPVGLPAAASLRATVKLPVELGAQATVRRTFSAASRAPREPILEAFPEALVRGTNKNVRVKVNNQGSAPLELLSAVPSDLLVELRTPEGTTLSSARLSQSGNGAQPSPSGFFVSVPGGSSVLLDPVSIFVPDALGASAQLRVRLERVFNGLVAGPVTGPRDFETVKTLSGVSAPPYTASVSPQHGLYDQGSSVLLQGEARDEQAQLVPGATVQIGVSVRGFERVASTRTDETGHYQLTFSPAPAESGQYTLWAAHPEVVDRAPQSSFTIVGLSWQFSDYTATLTQNSAVPFRVNLTNVGQSRIEGLSATAVSSAVLAGTTLTLDPASLPAVLEAGQSASVSLTASAGAAAALGRSRFVVRVTESHGFVRELPVNADVAASAPAPSIEPTGFNVGMSAGQTRTLEVRLKNSGTRAWEGVFVTAPTLPWVRVSGSSTLGDVPPGGSKSLFLALEPPSSLPSQAFAANPLVEIRSANATAIPVNALITLTASGLGNVAYTVINADKPRNQFGAGEGVPTSEVTLVSLDVSGLSFRATADSNGVVRLLNVPAGRYSYTAKAAGFEDASGTETVEPGVTLQKELLLLTNVVSYEWSVEPTTIQDQYNIQLGITFKTDVPAPVVVMEPAVMNFNLGDGQSTDAQLTVENKGLVSAFDVDLLPAGRDSAIVIDMPYSRIPELKAGQKVVVPIRVTLIHASCHTEDLNAGYGYTCAAGTTVRKNAPATKISAGDCFNLPTTSVGGGSGGPGGGGGFGGSSGGSGGSGISLSVPASYMSYAIPNPPSPPAPPNSCRPPSEKYPSECTRASCAGAYSDSGGDPRIPESDLSVAVPKFAGSLDFTRVYDSQDYDQASMGRAWSHSFASRVQLVRAASVFFPPRADGVANVSYSDGLQTLTVEIGTDTSLHLTPDWLAELRTPSGERLLFRHSGGSGFAAPPGETSTLTMQGSTAAPTGFTWTWVDKTQYVYDGSGRLLSITDRNNSQVNLVYSGGLLTGVKDPDDRTLYTLTYSGGKLASVTDLAGRNVSFSYDGNGYLSQSQGPKGAVSYGYTSYEVPGLDFGGFANGIFAAYKSIRLLTSVTAPNGQATTFAYGPPKKSVDYDVMPLYLAVNSGQNFDIGNAGFGAVPMRIGELTPPVSKTYYTPVVPSGNGYAVDSEGFARWYIPQRFFTLSESGPMGTYTFEHAVDELLEGGSTVTTDSQGNKETRYWENRRGRAQTGRHVDASGRTVTTVYDANRRPAQITTPLGTISTLFNSKGDLTSVRDEGGAQTTIDYEPTFGLVRTLTDNSGSQAGFQFDGNGNITQIAQNGSNVTLTYDANGVVHTIADANTHAVEIGRNQFGHLTSFKDALDRVTAFERDDLGRLTAVVDADSKRTEIEYDPDDNIIKVINPALGELRFTYTPGPLDTPKLLSSVRDAKNQTVQFTYDSRGRPETSVNALGQTRSYTFDANDNPATETNVRGQIISFAYDALGRLKTETSPEGATVYEYDQKGYLASIENSVSRIVLSYDGSGRRIGVQQTNKAANLTTAVSYSYDAADRLISMSLAGSPQPFTQSYTYDSHKRPASIIGFNNQTYLFSYDTAGRRTKLSYPNDIDTQYTYDDANQVLRVEHRRRSTASILAFNQYQYDGVGNRAQMDDAAGSHTYSYDELRRLTEARHPSASSITIKTEVFAYDAVGNRLGQGRAYNAANRLLSAAGVSYSHDNDGNLTAVTAGTEGTTFAYDSRDQLVRIEKPDGAIITYLYDGLGRRIEAKVTRGATTAVRRFIYDEDDIIAELDGNNTVTALFTHGPGFDEPLAVYKAASNANYFIHLDGAGSVMAHSSPSGGLVERVEYESFGRPIYSSLIDLDVSTTSLTGSPFAFSAREFDGDSGLYYFRSRYLDPSLGRFLSEDSQGFDGGSANFYAYAANNPYVLKDASGKFIVPVLLGAWAVYEVLASVYDLYSLLDTMFNPCASPEEKAWVAASFGAGLVGPGGGYTGPAKRLAKRARPRKVPRPVLIGETSDRVRKYAKDHGYQYYSPKGWDSSRTKKAFEENMRRNMDSLDRWMREGREIIDYGLDRERKDRGPFYAAEVTRLKQKNYKKWRKVR